jgi:hypothetical protein
MSAYGNPKSLLNGKDGRALRPMLYSDWIGAGCVANGGLPTNDSKAGSAEKILDQPLPLSRQRVLQVSRQNYAHVS